MKIVFDLDGVICSLKEPEESYSQVRPNFEVIKILQDLKRDGHYIILNTARHMASRNGNIGRIVADIGGITLDWLKKNNVPFDELYFGKPHADIYVDDMNIVYSNPPKLINDIRLITSNFIIPMAGKGKRFLEAGYEIPKYMIKAGSETLLEWSLKSLPLDLASKVIFICLREHQEKYKVTEFIKKIIDAKYSFLKDKYTVILIEKITRGQAETALSAKQYIDDDISLAIFNIDSYFVSSRLRQKMTSAKNQQIDGILGSFCGSENRWSFIGMDERGFVNRTTEKDPISDIASTGFYFFTKGNDFIDAAEYMIKNNLSIKGEFYVAPLYNILVAQNKKIIVDRVEEFWPLGTPEDLNYFTDNYLKFGKK